MIVPVLSALLPFVASSSIGSSARRRKRKPVVVDEPNENIVRLQSLLSAFGDVETLMAPSTVLFVKRDGGEDRAFQVSERDSAIMDWHLSKISPDKICFSSLVDTNTGTGRLVETEVDRLLQFKHYQMKTLFDESRPLVEDHPSSWPDWFQPGEPKQNLLLVHNGSVWAGLDYIQLRESEFPTEVPYQTPFKSLNPSQAYVNDLIRNAPDEVVYSLVDSIERRLK